MLVKACNAADLEAVTYEGFTPLHVAVQVQQPAVITTLIDAGSDVNSRTPTGESPLYTAAMRGYVDVVKLLLEAKANPLLPRRDPSGHTYVPLDVAAQSGHAGVVHELIKRFGVIGCGGSSGGVDALSYAAQEHHTDVLTMLAEAGVVDMGVALHAAVRSGSETSVKFLLHRRRGRVMSQRAYVNGPDVTGSTPFIRGIAACRSRSARIMRLLVDAGADATSTVRVTRDCTSVVFNDTPLALATGYLRQKSVDGRQATKEELYRLEAIRRLLLRVEEIRAVSWGWPSSDTPSISRTADGVRLIKQSTASTSGRALRPVIPILRRKARKSRVGLPDWLRWVHLCDVMISSIV